MKTYQNLTNQEQIIPNVGIILPQGTINTELELNNPNLKPITNQPPVAPQPVPQPVQVAPELPQEGEN